MENIRQITYPNSSIVIYTYISSIHTSKVASHILDLGNDLLIVDSQYIIADADLFHNFIVSLRKPIIGIILTHAHPDHYMGLERFESYSRYAFKEVVVEMAKNASAILKEDLQQWGDRMFSNIIYPNTYLLEGTMKVDNITVEIIKIIKAEDKTQTIIAIPDMHVIIIQDLGYNNVHPWLGNIDDIDNWIQVLELLLLASHYQLYIVGHGDPMTPQQLKDFIKYLREASRRIKTSRDANEFKEDMIGMYPQYCCSDIMDKYLKRLSDHFII